MTSKSQPTRLRRSASPRRERRRVAASGGSAPGDGVSRLLRPFAALMMVIVLSLLLAPPPARAQEAELEYKLKAAFLYNFLKFTEWPAHKYSPPEPAMVVACLEDDPAAPLLAKALEARTVGGRPIKFVTLRDTDDWRNCNLLFLSRTRKVSVDDLVARLKNAPVLTVGEADGFAQRGGMINFVRHERTFRFEINLEAAERAKLRLSSDLSNMATVVKTQPTK